MKKFIKPLLVAIIYLIAQGIAGGIIGLLVFITEPAFMEAAKAGNEAEIESAIPPSWLACMIIVSGLLTVIIASAMKLINWKTAFHWNKKQASEAWLPLIAAITGIFAITVFEEQLQLEDQLADQFASMMHSTAGILGISLFGPIIEELCFREALMGGLIRRGMKPWLAIFISAAIFGLIHGNPVQIVGAGLIGIILGTIYYKSGNIVLTSILHVINNSFATFLAITYGMDTSLSEITGSTTATIVSGIICAVFSTALFVRYWKFAK